MKRLFLWMALTLSLIAGSSLHSAQAAKIYLNDVGGNLTNAGGTTNGAYATFTTLETPSLIVNTTDDTVSNTDGANSLREAVNFANSDGVDSPITITVSGPITLTAGELALNNNGTVSITGPAAGVTILGNNNSIFTVNSGANVTLDRLTLSNGTRSGFGGGAIYNAGGTLTITNSTLSNNTAPNAYGGAILNTGTLTITNSTLSNNSAYNGGAICDYNGGAMTLTNSTLSGNTATSQGGAIYNITNQKPLRILNCTITGNIAPMNGGAGVYLFAIGRGNQITQVQNSIIAANRTSAGGAPDSGTDVDFSTQINGSFTSLGYNRIGDGNGAASFGGTGDLTGITATQLSLGALTTANGGLTATIALQSGSVVSNTGDPQFDGTGKFDQRGTGYARVQGGRLDIGAYESNFTLNAAPVIATNTGLSLTAGTTAIITSAMLKATDADGDALTYTVTTAPTKGTLKLDGVATSSFTQADIAAKKVSYTQDGSLATGDTFAFSVSDGNGGSVAGNFAIAIEQYALSASLGNLSTAGVFNATVTWRAPAGSSSTDWIALYRKGAPNNAYLQWRYTGGATSGNWTVSMPAVAGEYEFRYLINDSFNVALASNTVTVTNAAATLRSAPSAASTSASPSSAPGASRAAPGASGGKS